MFALQILSQALPAVLLAKKTGLKASAAVTLLLLILIVLI